MTLPWIELNNALVHLRQALDDLKTVDPEDVFVALVKRGLEVQETSIAQEISRRKQEEGRIVSLTADLDAAASVAAAIPSGCGLTLLGNEPGSRPLGRRRR